jgi:ABC-2 type transport system ATP-binding protein
VIEATGLRRTFGGHVAVDGLSLSVPAGAILALLGPNGAGKTTTVRMLAGLLAPSSGRATVAGRDVRRDPAAVRARVGLVADAPGLYDQMTPSAYLDFFGRIYGVEPEPRRRRIDNLLGHFDLADVARTRMVGFSRGMQQKVALARALLHEPDVLFLDEPTANLDPLATQAVRDLIRAYRDGRRSVVLCTHDLDEAERLADEVVILSHGRVVASGANADLRSAAGGQTLVRVALVRSCPAAVEVASAIGGVFAPRLEAPTLLVYRTARPEATNPAVVAGLVAAGAAIVSATCSTATLEEAYARVVSAETSPAADGRAG